MCNNFSYLKDRFPLPRINQLVDAIVRHGLLSFVDVYSRYNQIRIHEADQQKTTLITDQSLYCYMVIPFGLNNARAIYQRLVNIMFVQKKLGHTIELYGDEMLTKSLKPENHVKDLKKSLMSYEVQNKIESN